MPLNVLALLVGALVWGLAWYPYRALRETGVGAEWATVLTYGVALICLIAWFRGRLFTARPTGPLLALMLAGGSANVGFLVAAIYGEVVRVTLLFYLAPAWTIFLAWGLLAESPTRTTLATTLLALVGAAVMLWNPALGAPLPHNVAEWLALGAGIAFAAANVLVRKTGALPAEVKSLYIFAGCVVMALVAAAVAGHWVPRVDAGALPLAITLTVLLGLTMLIVNFVVQYGLVNTPANQAIVIYLSELVFAALGAWLLADEGLDAKSALGGALIVCASLISAREAAQSSAKEA